MSFLPSAQDRLLALINQANPNLPIPVSAENLYFGNAHLVSTAMDGVSSIVPTTGMLGDVYYGNYVDFQYKRINLSTAYDLIPVMNSVGASTLYGMLDIVNQFLGLNLTQQDVIDTNVAYVQEGASVNINIQALPGSLGFTGAMLLQFNRIRPTLQAVIPNVELNVQNYDNIDPTLNKQDIGMLMWNVDFSPFVTASPFTNTLGVMWWNGQWYNPALVAAAIKAQFGFTDWPVPAGFQTPPAKVPTTVTDYATANYPGSNTNFQRVVVQTNVVGATYTGTALFHYNPS